MVHGCLVEWCCTRSTRLRGEADLDLLRGGGARSLAGCLRGDLRWACVGDEGAVLVLLSWTVVALTEAGALEASSAGIDAEGPAVVLDNRNRLSRATERCITCVLERSQSTSSRHSRIVRRFVGSTSIIPARMSTTHAMTGSFVPDFVSSAQSAGSLSAHLPISYCSKGCSCVGERHSATNMPRAKTISFSPLTDPELPRFVSALSSGAQCSGLPMEAAGIEVRSLPAS